MATIRNARALGATAAAVFLFVIAAPSVGSAANPAAALDPPTAALTPSNGSDPAKTDMTAGGPIPDGAVVSPVNDAVASSQALLSAAGVPEGEISEAVTYDPPVLTIHSGVAIPGSVLARIRSDNPAVTVTVHKTRYKVSELTAEAARIVNANLATVVSAAPNSDYSGLNIGVGDPSGAPATAAGLARTSLPDPATLTSYPATVDAEAAAVPATRENDSNPVYGGGELYNRTADFLCSAGFGVNYTLASSPTTSRTGFVTAGHCLTGTYYDGTNTRVLGSSSNGIADLTKDIMVLSAASAANRVWINGYSSGTSRAVYRAYNPAAGMHVCADGAMSGEVCTGVTVSAVLNLTKSYKINGVLGSHGPLFEIVNDSVVSGKSPCVVQGGDSGGPVYHYIADGRVEIHGLLVANEPSLSTTYCPGTNPDVLPFKPPPYAPTAAGYANMITAALTSVRANAKTG